MAGGTEGTSTTSQDPTADPSTNPGPSTANSESMTTFPPESSSSSEGGSESTSLDPDTTSSSSGRPETTTGSSSSGTTAATDFITTGSTTVFEVTTTTGGLGNGEQCMSNDECASDMCFLAGILGGVCGECLTEDDCTWGCHLPNVLAVPAEGAYCDDGMVGGGCDTDAGCMAGLECAVVVDVPGIITISGCSECDTDADCVDQCAPVYDDAFTMLEAYWECVGDGSLSDGAGCDLAGSGEECSSGECGEADIMGLVSLGICSECDNDNDCGLGETCQAPGVELDGTVTPGTCV